MKKILVIGIVILLGISLISCSPVKKSYPTIHEAVQHQIKKDAAEGSYTYKLIDNLIFLSISGVDSDQYMGYQDDDSNYSFIFPKDELYSISFTLTNPDEFLDGEEVVRFKNN